MPMMKCSKCTFKTRYDEGSKKSKGDALNRMRKHHLSKHPGSRTKKSKSKSSAGMTIKKLAAELYNRTR